MTSGLRRQLYSSLLLLSVVCGSPPFDSCTDIYPINNGEYSFQNANHETYSAYCEFHAGYVYMFIPATTNVSIDITSIGPSTTEVLVRHLRLNGGQYDTTFEQLSSYSNVPLSVQYNTYANYQGPANRATLAPFMFLGFLPLSIAGQKTTQGYRANGQDFTFNNCDGNGNSYLAFYFDPNSGVPTRTWTGNSPLMRYWIDLGTLVSNSLPDDYFFPTCEMHMGGCGGFALTGRSSLADISGAVMGLYLDINECNSNPCQNGATCNNQQNSYTCTCADGWTGNNCEQDINECDSNPCQNGASCNNQQNSYTCTCADGWTGNNCEQDINECDSNPCQNGASCNNQQNSYTCTCADGWTGNNCEQDINECDSNPCQNGATCNNQQNSYTCTCADGWTGNNCEQDINECDSNPCQNGATCNNQQNSYTCTCADGWTGNNCEQDINECDSNPCQNGATCNNQQNSYTCTCADGWTGNNCEQDINECDSNPCQNGATCNNQQNSYTCTCADGWTGNNCEQADVTFYCYPNNNINVYYLPPDAYTYAMQNSTETDVQCNISTIDSRTVTMTGCTKDLPILLSFGSYADMGTHNLHAGRSLTTVIIKCNEIPDTGNIHAINNTLAASLQIDEETGIDPTYDVTSFLNTTSTVVGNAVTWTISFPVEYILEVTSCTAYAGTDDSSSLSVTLISAGGCNAVDELISDFVDNMDGSATAIIHAFKFYDEDSVFLQCSVTICPDITGQSCNTSCSRTKREIGPADSGEPVSQYQRSIQNTLRVVEPNHMYSDTVRNVPAFTVGVSLLEFTLPFVFILP